MNALLNNSMAQRRRWIVRGQVQGVGFRPYVYRLAHTRNLTGFVGNTCDGVIIEAQGTPDNLIHFAAELKRQLPPLAHIRDMTHETIATISAESGFEIAHSDASGNPNAAITPDTALCADCRMELFDPANRRWNHALITCTNCGPRYSMILDIPYDRPATTMAKFPMCAACGDEYERPADRRFHAQPIACHDCGPKVTLVDTDGQVVTGDPIDRAAAMLRDGKILAIKGIGGFHLAARADDSTVVQRLRQLKQRDAKPLAIMCRSVFEARRFIKLSGAAETAMQSPAAPIALGMRQTDAPVAAQVAEGNCRLGVMLPYTPLHHLLFAHLDQAVPALIMTSGNITDEPLAISNEEAMERLGGLCDGFLWHDRPIARCVDDSVVLDMGPTQPPVAIRRSRGFVPTAISIPNHGKRTGLCLGGELKNTVALVLDSQVVLSQHLGDLNNNLARTNFMKTIDDMCRLYKAKPEFIAHDLHPLYISAQYAAQLARRWNAQLIPVQHHHAHAAAVLAEHGVQGPVLALICDGTGLGVDGTGWGCELFRASAENCQRLASLNPILLPGGDVAAQDIRRCALAILFQTFGPDFDRHPAAARLVPDSTERQILALMLRRGIQCVTSSSAGRMFDGVAVLLGLCLHNRYEAEAPIALETAAGLAQVPENTAPLWDIIRADNDVDRLDLRPLFAHLVAQREKNVSAQVLAAVFHSQFAAAWEDVIGRQAATEQKLNTVALSGGVCANEIFVNDLTERLERRGLVVLRHHLVPPNDGGLALGQALVAAARWKTSSTHRRKNEMECVPCV